MRAALFFCSLLLSGIATADRSITGDYCELRTRDTTSNCDSNETYAGPAKPSEHGGVCMVAGGNCSVSAGFTRSKQCQQGSIYVGPNRPDLHGGTCVRLESRDFHLKVDYIENDNLKNCGLNGVYMGPARPSQHGGYCVYVVREESRFSAPRLETGPAREPNPRRYEY